MQKCITLDAEKRTGRDAGAGGDVFSEHLPSSLSGRPTQVPVGSHLGLRLSGASYRRRLHRV